MGLASVGDRTETPRLGAESELGRPLDTQTCCWQAVERLARWQDWYGPLSQDQYDFWAWPLGGRTKRTYYGGSRPGYLLAGALAALDSAIPAARKLVRHPTRFPIADAHYVMGHLAVYAARRNPYSLERAEMILDALKLQRCRGFTDYCWGYPFDWVTVDGTWPAETPLITTTPYVYEAFEAYHEVAGDPESLHVMQSIATWASDGLHQTGVAPGQEATAYTPLDRRRVVNASAYRGYLLGAAGRRFGREDWLKAADANLKFVVGAQRQDGSWLYAVDGRDPFIDNFHTCFVLKNLAKSLASGAHADVNEALQKGYHFYKTALLDESGLPKPFAVTQRTNLVRRELYDYAEGINLALLMRGVDEDADAILARLVDDLVTHWQMDDGHFRTRTTVMGKNTVPYHRWAQSQVFRALALVAASGEPQS